MSEERLDALILAASRSSMFY